MRDNVWPYWDDTEYTHRTYFPPDFEPFIPWEHWDADTMFDVIEVVHDLVSKPISGREHTYNDCGWHYDTFNRTDGQLEVRKEMNRVLRLSDPAYEIDGHGQIVEAAPEEFRQLLSAPVPPGTPHDLITSRIDAAVQEFQARGVTLDGRRHAVRDLADVLEALRPDIKEHMLSKDEGALFDLANNFALRHNTRKQRGDYDKVTWLRWAFYVYLIGNWTEIGPQPLRWRLGPKRKPRQ
jgi:hypothetical protein